MSDESMPLPPAALIVSLSLDDFDRWKASFDNNESVRIDHGFLGHQISRGQEDPNQVTVYLASSDVEKGKAFATSSELAEVMQKAGVNAPPELVWGIPKREAVIWDQELPAMIVRHSVADFGAWLSGYDGADGLRTANGIVGHAANQVMDDPNRAVVYHQAQTFEALNSFLASPDLRAAMESAGVTSTPEVTFHTSLPGKLY